MEKNTIQIETRVCTRASCALRYPVVAGTAGDRCPRCRAETRVVALQHTSREQESNAPLQAARIPFVILDNIRSAWNVGAIFRTADGLGIGRLILAGITPTPEVPGVRKTSLGAEERIGWTYVPDAVIAARQFIQQGGSLWGLEIAPGASSLYDTDTNIPGKDGSLPGMVVGNEVCGVDPGLLDLCEKVVYLPMAGAKRSLNVAISFGVAAYHLVFASGR